MIGDSMFLEITDEILASLNSAKIIKVAAGKNTTTVSTEWPQTRMLGSIRKKKVTKDDTV